MYFPGSGQELSRVSYEGNSLGVYLIAYIPTTEIVCYKFSRYPEIPSLNFFSSSLNLFDAFH